MRNLLSFVREHALLRAGERIGVAVSGGADSVALLRALLELRAELGVVLSVVHVNHGIRPEAESDAEFVATLTRQHSLEFHLLRRDVPALAREKKMSLEAAGREVRYGYFAQLVASGFVEKVATAHTFDDQAETVLLRLFRGAGLQGLAGIHKQLRLSPDSACPEVIRPLLAVSRREVIAYLEGIGQDWREDASNADVRMLRNRVRHELLPLLEQNYNPAVRQTLANLAEMALSDSEYLASAAHEAFGTVADECDRTLRIGPFLELPIALQRQVLILAASRYLAGVRLEFEDIEDLRRVAAGEMASRQVNSGHGVERIRTDDGYRLRFTTREGREIQGETEYSYSLDVPGEVWVRELNSVVRAQLLDARHGAERYNPAELLDSSRLQAPLTLRNFRPGDRFHPLHSKGAEKLKRLFLEQKIPRELRPAWPVLLSGEDVVWVRGFAVSAEHALRPGSTSAVFVEEIRKDGKKRP